MEFKERGALRNLSCSSNASTNNRDLAHDAGNTIVVIKTAVWLIDMGPEGGVGGGKVVVAGTPEEVAAHAGSQTGRFLKAVLAA